MDGHDAPSDAGSFPLPLDSRLGRTEAKNANEEEFIYQPALPFVTPIDGAGDADPEPA
jgi:hypothetical protein